MFMIKKWVLVLLIMLLIPSVYSLTSQEWLNKHNFHPSNPVVVGSQIRMQVIDNSGNVVLRNPIVGEDISFEINEEGVYRIAYIFDDDFNLITNFSLNGIYFYGYKSWLHKLGESSKISTSGWKPQDYHIISYTFKYDYTSNKYYDNSWKVYSFSLMNQTSTLPTRGPVNNPFVNCQNTLPAKLTKGTYTLCKQNYDLNQSISIWDDGVILDCNGATLKRTSQPQTAVTLELRGKDITIKNCILGNVRLYALEEKENITVENNEFIGINTYLSLAVSKSSIKNNIIDSMILTSNTVSPTAPKVGKNIIENNKIGAIDVFESNENSILNNSIIQMVLEGSSRNIIKNNNIVMTQNYAQTSVPASILLKYSGNLDSEENLIENNIFNGKNLTSVSQRNVTGIVLGSENNTISKNIFANYEIGVNALLYFENNIIKNNDFLNNNLHIIDGNNHNNIYDQNYYDNHQCIKQGNYCVNSFKIMDETQSTVMTEDKKPSAIKNK